MYFLDDGPGIFVVQFEEGVLESLLAKQFFLVVESLCNTIGIEDYRLARLYLRQVILVFNILEKLFPAMPEEDRNGFIFEFFPFMYGIYPYAYPTEKQQKAMEAAGMENRRISIEAITEKFVLDILGRRK